MGDKTIIFFSKILIMIILKATIITGVMGYDYYWRDYDGVNIPNDALEVGRGSNTYIAQVYVSDYGIYVGTLHKGQNFVEVSAYGDRKPTENIKILCTDVSHNPPENMWLKTTTETFHVDVIEQYPINGGYDNVNNGLLNIGRLSHSGSLVAGVINSYLQDNVHLFYAYGGQEYNASAFQVLVNPPAK